MFLAQIRLVICFDGYFIGGLLYSNWVEDISVGNNLRLISKFQTLLIVLF